MESWGPVSEGGGVIDLRPHLAPALYRRDLARAGIQLSAPDGGTVDVQRREGDAWVSLGELEHGEVLWVHGPQSPTRVLRGVAADTSGSATLTGAMYAAAAPQLAAAAPSHREAYYLDVDPPSQRLTATGVFSTPAGMGLLVKLRRLPTTSSGLVLAATPGGTANASLYLYRPASPQLFLRGRTAAGGNTILAPSIDLATDAPIVACAYQDATTWWYRVAVGGAVVHAATGSLVGTPTTPTVLTIGGPAVLPWGAVAGDVDLIYAAPIDGLPVDDWLASASAGPVDPHTSGVVTHVYRADAYAADGEGFAAPDDLGGPALVAANMTIDDWIEL